MLERDAVRLNEYGKLSLLAIALGLGTLAVGGAAAAIYAGAFFGIAVLLTGVAIRMNEPASTPGGSDTERDASESDEDDRKNREREVESYGDGFA